MEGSPSPAAMLRWTKDCVLECELTAAARPQPPQEEVPMFQSWRLPTSVSRYHREQHHVPARNSMCSTKTKRSNTRVTLQNHWSAAIVQEAGQTENHCTRHTALQRANLWRCLANAATHGHARGRGRASLIAHQETQGKHRGWQK